MIPELNTIHRGDCLQIMKSWPDKFVHCVVTSPPYWGLRDYGMGGQAGLEDTPEAYTEKMVHIFREVKRILRNDGTLWLNLGDSYSEKQLCGAPWRVAFALQSMGWCLRSDIIWHKPNPMPSSVLDRPTLSHEYLFLLTKNTKYYYNGDAIRESLSESMLRQIKNGDVKKSILSKYPDGWARHKGGHGSFHKDGREKGEKNRIEIRGANKRSVWTVSTQAYPEAHFATFPEALIKPCILAGCPKEGIVLDPFMGSGTTGLVAKKLSCNYLGIELNPEYIKLAKKRIAKEYSLF